MSKSLIAVVIASLALSSISCSSSKKDGTRTGDAGSVPNNTGNGGSSSSNVDGGTNPSNGGSSNGSSGSSNGGSSNGGSGAGEDGLCGDTTDVDSFFESHVDIQIPLVYDDGMTGFEDAYLEPGWKLDFAIIGADKSVILVEPIGSTMGLGGYNADTDSYEDTAEEVNLMLDPEIGYDVI
ncbi:MAG TPA: hypothetical protein VHO25_19170, partial [Polyangiaceae bacterium]|nr:hypothetical protein [Polyangiaceae bacterium]